MATAAAAGTTEAEHLSPARAEIAERVQVALSVLLTNRERQVIQRRFGVGTGRPAQDLEDIAFELDLPLLAARRALVLGLAKLGRSEFVQGAHAELVKLLRASR